MELMSLEEEKTLPINHVDDRSEEEEDNGFPSLKFFRRSLTQSPPLSR